MLLLISLQLHLSLHQQKLFPIGGRSVADQYTNHSENIYQDSLRVAQWWFRLYKLHSLSANLPPFLSF